MSNKKPTIEEYEESGKAFNAFNNIIRETDPERADEIQKDIDAYNALVEFMKMFTKE